MKIIRLQASNVKRLKAVDITPAGAVVRVQGANGAGKTSVLDAITYALGGKEVHPPRVIREGEDHAKVVLELDDLVVERRWTAKGTHLEVRSREGAVHKSPQAILDKLVGALSFDPLTFMRLAPRDQADLLRQLAGLDFSPLETRRQELYGLRTAANRQVADLEAQVRALPPPTPGVPEAEVSLAELTKRAREAIKQRAANDRKRAQVQQLRREMTDRERAVAHQRGVVAELEGELAKARKDLQAKEAEARAADDKLAMAQDAADALVDPDHRGLDEEMATAEQTNRQVRQARARKELEARLAAAQQKAGGYDRGIAELDQQKAQALAAAKLPLPGLSVEDGGVLLSGIPLEQASAAEKLRVSLAMGIALNPKLRVMLIRDGSLLDERSMQMVAEMAAASGSQVWIEVVSTTGGTGVLIEDGEATGPEARPVQPEAQEEAPAP